MNGHRSASCGGVNRLTLGTCLTAIIWTRLRSVHVDFGFRASSFWTIIFRSRARTAAASVAVCRSPSEIGAVVSRDSCAGLSQRRFGRESGRDRSATSELLITCREVLSLVVFFLESFQFCAQRVGGEFGERQACRRTGQVDGGIAPRRVCHTECRGSLVFSPCHPQACRPLLSDPK